MTKVRTVTVIFLTSLELETAAQQPQRWNECIFLRAFLIEVKKRLSREEYTKGKCKLSKKFVV